MNANLLLLITLAVIVISCDTRPKFVQEFEKNKDVYKYQWTVTDLGKLVDTTLTIQPIKPIIQQKQLSWRHD
ncbi:hypothetical protein BTO06_11940 [Tenacibaculum sp. SZ-18]|uniref:hypothetical protein n=1 Tax=Tenacibaculum sp. SZ-18 TaxID=754423 RepID=UPI000C2D52DD|nr:hypothetical protein [Tenacibaculum sp. SZ-18]AUC15815.1 hypothetical protein BTO06_11940 [Tenacibaculum sp. SZ-18]